MLFLHRHNRCSHHSECISKLDAIPLHWTPPLRNSHRSIPTGLLQCVSRICMALVCLSQCLDTKNMYQKDGKSLEVTPGDLTLFRSVVGWMETENILRLANQNHPFQLDPEETPSKWVRTFRGSLKGRVSFIYSNIIAKQPPNRKMM